MTLSFACLVPFFCNLARGRVQNARERTTLKRLPAQEQGEEHPLPAEQEQKDKKAGTLVPRLWRKGSLPSVHMGGAPRVPMGRNFGRVFFGKN